MAKNALVAIVGLILIALVWAWWHAFKATSLIMVTSYEECVAAGYPVMESFPPQCRTSDGRTFISPEEPSLYR